MLRNIALASALASLHCRATSDASAGGDAPDPRAEFVRLAGLEIADHVEPIRRQAEAVLDTGLHTVANAVERVAQSLLSRLAEFIPETAITAANGVLSDAIAAKDEAQAQVNAAHPEDGSHLVALLIVDDALPTLTEGIETVFTFNVSGAALPFTDVSFSQSGLDGMDFDHDTFDLTGTPTAAGGYSATLSVTDSAGRTVSKPFTGTVGAAAGGGEPGQSED